MFWLQPMLGKALLPRTGGVPAAWLVAMAFFQLCLLAGYVLAHLASCFGARRHVALWLGLLALAGLYLPPHIALDIKSSSSSLSWQVFKALAFGAGAPFMALSMTSSTLQRLYAATPEGARNPYILFSASNFGSFLGLLAYPLVLEPWLGLSQQRFLWSCLYAFVIAGGLLALFLSGQPKESRTPRGKPATGRLRLMWITYAAVPSSLSMGFTDRVTTDIASAPLLWALPLAIYLLTFVEAFAARPRFRAEKVEEIFLYLGAFEIAVELFGSDLPLVPMFAFALLSFSFGALALHKRLAALRPDTGLLTEYYVFIALGGALGGCFNAFIAPLLFARPIEFALAVMAALALLGRPASGKAKEKRSGAWRRDVFGVATLAVLMAAQFGILKSNYALLGFVVLFLLTVAIFVTARPVFLAPVFSLLLIADWTPQLTPVIARSRNFFGTVSVSESGEGNGLRLLNHGTTLHGAQFQSPSLSREALTYYGSLSPIRDVLRLAPEGGRLVFVGLGAGSMACLVPEGSKASFIEIDPQVAALAKKYFSFLEQCPPERIEISDGRLGIEALPDGGIDLLVIDAFSSDSIPAHMLTVEAMKLYARKSQPDGLIALHLSNRYLELAPPAAAALREAGLTAVVRKQMQMDDRNKPSIWLAAARDERRLAPLKRQNKDWTPASKAARAWTDDYTDILSALRIFNK